MDYVIVTGAAGGIGQALVRAFADAGHTVVGIDHIGKPEGLSATHFIDCDLARTVEDPAYADETFASIRRIISNRPLAALVNNAAVQVLGKSDELDRAAWHRTLNINLLAPFFWTQALLPELEATQGCVINISSIHARLTKPEFVAYATSKAALSGMTRAMAVDLGKRVRMNAIEPAAIETPMLKASFEHKPEGYRHLQQYHPAGRIGRVEEVAKLALAIMNNDMGFMHGTCVRMDGGISARLFDPD